MKQKTALTLLFALCGIVGLPGCQSAPPMSEATFVEAAKVCGLRASTYTYRDEILLDEPLIDFTKESEPSKARDCFNAALEKIDRQLTEHGVDHISYIWEWRA